MPNPHERESLQQLPVACAGPPIPMCAQPQEHPQATSSAPPLRLRKVAEHPRSPDVLARLKNTRIGRVYVQYLKKIPYVRSITIFSWRILYPAYINYIHPSIGSYQTTRWRQLVNLASYVKMKALDSTQLLEGAPITPSLPNVFPAEELGYFVSPHTRHHFPPIYVAAIHRATVYGGTNLVFTPDAVVCHDLYDFERDYTSEELHGRHVIDSKNGRIRLLCHDDDPERIPIAATFIDACASNYAHWLTEVLPRVAAFCSQEQFANIPIIVNAGLHQNLMESLAMVAGPEREVFLLPTGRAIHVNHLYLTSATGYVPFARRNARLTGHSHGLFSPLALDLLRSRILPFLDHLALDEGPKKIYLRRTTTARQVTNTSEIEELLIANGYTALVPENLTFLQQVRFFRGAKAVLAPTGASLANAIFCAPGTVVGIMMAKHEEMIYRYWTDMVGPLGMATTYVLGQISPDSVNGIHSDYYIARNDVIDAIRSWSKN